VILPPLVFPVESLKNLTLDGTPGACTIKLITAVIYGFRNKLECSPLNNRLG
jgi:hypothetical protein